MQKHWAKHMKGPAAGRARAASDMCPTALLILDMISDFSFEDGAVMCRRSWPVAQRIAKLKERARRAGIPTIYINDHFGRWRADFSDIVRYCSGLEKRGARIVKLLNPGPDDHRLLKPRHSAFFSTALDSLLEHLKVRKLIVTGISSHQCVLFTANDAYVRSYELVIPRDCVTAPSHTDQTLALQYFQRVLKAEIGVSASLKLRRHESKSKTAA